MSTDDGTELATVAGLLDSSVAREILVRTARQSQAAGELAATCDSSRMTVYRYLDRLTALGLVTASTEIDPDGHHFESYRATLDRITIDLTEDGFAVTVDRTSPADDAVDRLERLFDQLQ
jgi:predicted transcriptional regulator